MKDKKPTYTLTLTSAQCRAVCSAVELLMRLKINQPEEIPRGALQWGDGLSVEEWCKRRDKAEPRAGQSGAAAPTGVQRIVPHLAGREEG